MDPITQGALGAALPSSVAKPEQLRCAAIVGVVAGMAPDLDVLIRSSVDPLLFLEYHRQFTHSVLFIPIGALLCAAFLYGLFRRPLGLSFKQTLLFSFLGYGTHALLDACTSYGTLLLWPFSHHRFAWDTVSVIDPLVTLPLLALVCLACRYRATQFAAAAVAWVVLYQGLGYYQQQRAIHTGWELAEQRGHRPDQVLAKPSLGNIILWRTMYTHKGSLFSDGVRTGLHIRHYPGNAIPLLDQLRDYPWLDPASQQARDIARFNWFSQGYGAVDPSTPLRIIDARYAMLPTEQSGLWSIQLDPNGDLDAHVKYVVNRQIGPTRLNRFWQMLLGH
jgi:inner membrane protein